MRTIDADALIEQMEADAEHIDDPICKMFAYAAVSDVKHAPTIEPQKMRGKWNEHPKYTGIAYLCSQCNWFTTMRTHFCPNCGADMRGTANDD